MNQRVVYSRRAHRHLRNLYDWIVDAGAPDRADRFASSIYDFCDELSDFPHIGIGREDLLPGMRTIAFRRHTTIAYIVSEETIEVHGVYYGGRNFEDLILSEEY